MLIQSTYCRSCGVLNPKSETILTETWHNRALSEIFEECTNINIIADNFSKILCLSCYDKLIDFYNFRLLTQDTHAKLLKELGNAEIKEEIVDSDIVKEEVIVTPLMLKEDEEETKDDESFSDRIDSGSDYDPKTDSFTKNHKKIKRNTKSWEAGFVCLGCKQIFKRNLHLKRHLNETKGDAEHLWRCNECGNAFDLKKDLNLHLLKVHKEQSCSECQEKIFGTLALTKHLREKHKKNYSRIDCCPHCAKFVKNLRNHVAVVHKKIKRHYCHICNRGCVTKDTLRAHLRVHTGEKPFSCSFPGCNKTFKQSGHIRQHEKNFHGPVVDPVTCDVCGKLFKTKYTLKEHRKIHFGSTFKCNQCDNLFSIERYLKEHIKDVHDLADPVVCSDCGKMFKTPKRLQYHRRQHLGTEYICKICDKFFVNKRLLLDHTSSQHEKVRNYVCQVEGCGRAYYRMDNLRKHRKKCHTINK